MNITEEQQAFISCKVRKGQTIKVVAGAGTGKTTSLIQYALARTPYKMLYLCFNKAVQLEASERFPQNVRCKTGHSLAWPKFGSKYRPKLVPSLKANQVCAAMAFDSNQEAKFAMDTLSKYLQSADLEISGKHLPGKAMGYCKIAENISAGALLGYTEDLWARMQDLDDMEIGMLHDGYLKLWQLSNPQLNFDVILLDEAQDTNPTLAAVFLAQDQCVKVLVGDSHQQIYSFRGSRDFVHKTPSDFEFYLNKSFRFTSEIADIANKLLQNCKGEKQIVIEGLATPQDTGSRYTYIARTNGEIFSHAADCVEAGQKVAFVGGAKGYRFFSILDTYNLYARKNDRIRDKYIASFKTFQEMVEYAESVEDFELKGMISAVKKHRSNVPRLVNEILNSEVIESEADVICSTGHKCKGMEWDRVKLANDFISLVHEGEIVTAETVEPDEINLLYVAVTRAKYKVDLSESLQTFLNKLKSSKNKVA